MRIALMPSNYAPAVGGVEVLTARLARQLVLHGHSVEIWAPRSADDSLPNLEVIDGITVRRFVFAMPRADVRTLALLPRAAWRAIAALRSASKQFQPTHVHVQCFSGNGLYATILSHLIRIPLIVTLQGETVMDDHDIYHRSLTLRAALRWGLRSAAAVSGCSQFTLDDAVRRFGLSPAKSSVIFNGVDLDEVPPVPIDIPFTRYVLAIGRVVHKKGFDLLLAAFAKASADQPDVGLVIGGTGLELDNLRSLAGQLGIRDRVHFPGQLGRGQVAALMSGAEIFVMPSRLEPFGIVVLEAWRAGTPVIATSCGGAPEFVRNGVTGLTASPEDVAGTASALKRLLADTTLQRTLATQAEQVLPAFTWERLAKEYDRLYTTGLSGLGSATSVPAA